MELRDELILIDKVDCLLLFLLLKNFRIIDFTSKKYRKSSISIVYGIHCQDTEQELVHTSLESN